MAKVLLVDDELTMVQMVAELLRQEGHEVFPFTNGAAAVGALSTNVPELVITDLYLDKTRAHGLEILQKARELSPPAVVIVITGFGSIETAISAMKNGAFDYLEKPFKVDELRLCVRRALSYNAAITETAYLRKQLKKKYQFSQIVGNAAKMQAVYKLIERVAALLEESNALRRTLERPRPNESESAESERLLYFSLTGTIEAGLIRTVEELLNVLRVAGEPVGPMGAEWLARQERALTRERE